MICKTAVVAMTMSFAPGWRPDYIGSIDSAEYPVRCHWDLEIDADRCEGILEMVENAWQVQVEELGFVTPVLDEDGIFDIYLAKDANADTGGGAYVAGTSKDGDPDDGMSGCPSYMALDRGITDQEMESYVAHEFQHVLQWSTDFTELSLPVWEGVAEAATVWTLGGERGDYDMPGNYLYDFQETPWVGLLGDGYYLWDELELWSLYEYGSALWIFHLDDAYGDGQGSSAVALWRDMAQEGYPNEPDVLDGLDSVTGDWQQYLLELSLERSWVGTEASPDWATAHKTSSALVPLDAELQVVDLPASVEPVYAPLPTGVVYFTLAGLEAGQVLELSLSEEEGEAHTWGLVLTDGTTHHLGIESSTSWTASSSELLTIGVVHLGAPEWDADDRLEEAPFVLSMAMGEPADDGGGDEGGGTGGGGGGDPKGCGCATTSPGGLAWLWAGGLGLIFLRRRR